MTLVESILDAVARGCRVEIYSDQGVVFVEARKRTVDEVNVCSRGVGPYELASSKLGPDFVLAHAVQSTSSALGLKP